MCGTAGGTGSCCPNPGAPGPVRTQAPGSHSCELSPFGYYYSPPRVFFPHFHRESDLFLLDVQDLRAGTEGWLVFDVTAASNHWLVDRKYNLGLRLYVETDDGKPGQPTCSVWGQIPGNWSSLISPLGARMGSRGGGVRAVVLLQF